MTGAYKKLWFTEEQLRQLEDLGIRNVSEYLRDKMRADVDRGVSLRALKARIEGERAKLQELQAAFEARAVQVEDALRAFDMAAVMVRKGLAFGRGASVQSTILRWVQNNPNGRELRRFLPREYADDAAIADILARWPESKPGLLHLLEQEPPGLGGGAGDPRADDAARGEARASR